MSTQPTTGAQPRKIENWIDNGFYEASVRKEAAKAAELAALEKRSMTSRVFGQDADVEARIQTLRSSGGPIKIRLEHDEVTKMAVGKAKVLANADRNKILGMLGERSRPFFEQPMSGSITNEVNKHLAAAPIGGMTIPNDVAGSRGTFVEWFRTLYDTEIHLSDKGVSLPKLKPQVTNEERTKNGSAIFMRARVIVDDEKGNPTLGGLDPRYHKPGQPATKFTPEDIGRKVHEFAVKTFQFQEAQRAARLQQQRIAQASQQRQRGMLATATANAGRMAAAIPQMMQAPNRREQPSFSSRGLAPA